MTGFPLLLNGRLRSDTRPTCGPRMVMTFASTVGRGLHDPGRLRLDKHYHAISDRAMDDKLTKEEVEARARQIAQRLMAKPAQTQEWPKKGNPTKSPADVSKRGKRARVGAAS